MSPNIDNNTTTKDEKLFKLLELFSQLSEEQQELVIEKAITYQET